MDSLSINTNTSRVMGPRGDLSCICPLWRAQTPCLIQIQLLSAPHSYRYYLWSFGSAIKANEFPIAWQGSEVKHCRQIPHHMKATLLCSLFGGWGVTQDLNYVTLWCFPFYNMACFTVFLLLFLDISVEKGINCKSAALKEIVSSQLKRTKVCFYGLHVLEWVHRLTV